jgi:hypothetical protein
MLKRWQLKRLWMRPFTGSRFGEDLYEWLTAVGLGTQSGMSRKWCYWFREHVVLCRRYAGLKVPGRRLWLFEPGWSLAPVMLGRLVTGRGPLATEGRRRLARRYVSSAVTEVAEVAAAMCRSAGLTEPSLGLLDSLREARSPTQVLDICDVDYRICGRAELEKLPSEGADICISMGRLEHYSEDELRRLFSEMRRALSAGGVGSHIVDHRDHFWHFDRSGHCFRHLSYSDEQWAAIARGRKLYRNQLLESDYVRLFEEAGFDVLARVHELHRSDASEVDPRTLWGRYRELSREDLAAAVSHFVVRRT